MAHETHKEECEGLTIRIEADEDAANPFKEWDGEPDIIGWHRNYDWNTRAEDKGKSADDFLSEAKAKNYIVQPLYMYDHSGLSFSTAPFSCPWDSGQLGFIFWTKEKIAQGQGEKFAKRITKKRHEFLVKQLDSSVALLNDYAGGNVYGFIIEDAQGEQVESCWGFYGDYDSKNGCLHEAREVAKACAIRLRHEKRTALYDLALTLGISPQPAHAA